MTDNKTAQEVIAEASTRYTPLLDEEVVNIVEALEAHNIIVSPPTGDEHEVHEPDAQRIYCVRCGGNWPCQPAPVLPSSTVDEDALAEVVCFALDHRDGGEECEDDYKVARAVVAYLRGES